MPGSIINTMGIRFFCPNGHKLNVKAFQAGRRGICPHCGTGVDIPLQSTRPTSKQRRTRAKAAAPGAQAASAEEIPSPPPGPASNGEKAAEDPPSPLAPSNVIGQAPASPGDATTGVSKPQVSRTPSATSLGPSGSEPVALVKEIPPPGGLIDDIPDPLADGPEVVWYLRAPSGAQYGPATQQVMRSWLREGRVTPDSLVWREGWRDWEDAGDVFPESAFSETPIPDALPGFDGVVGATFGDLAGSRLGPIENAKSGLNQALIILALVALGAAILGAVYFCAKYL
jgi:hypothetical protein